MARRIGIFHSALILIALISTGSRAFAWNADGHKIVGAIADQILTENARQKVLQILGFNLRTAGPWLDCVKSVRQQDDGTFLYVVDNRYEQPCTPFANDRGRMEDYAKRNWFNCVYPAVGSINLGCHNTYHFDDVAIQRNMFDRNFQGTNDHDLVAAINAALAVLMDRPAPPPFSIKDKKEAILILAHVVGDITQPLHVGSVYLDTNGRLADPDVTHTIDPSTETIGGNALRDGNGSLHSLWDSVPSEWAADETMQRMVGFARGLAVDQGRIENRSVAWATDTLLVAQEAFSGLSFAKIDDKNWSVAFVDRNAYLRSAEATKQRQLAKGGAHLSALLNAIWP